MKRLEDTNPFVKIESAIALYKLGDKSYVGVITNGLGLDAGLILARRAAVISLRDIVENPAFEPLLRAAKGSHRCVGM